MLELLMLFIILIAQLVIIGAGAAVILCIIAWPFILMRDKLINNKHSK